MRRLYQRRADTMVFVTIAAISVGVLAAYFQMQEQADEPSDAGAPAARSERLLIMQTAATSEIALDREETAARMPHLAAALEEARTTGSAELTDRGVIDATWYQLVDAYGVEPRLPLVVTYEGASYRLQMVS